MTLYELLEGIEYKGNIFNQEVKSISHNSRKIPGDSLFVCIKGRNFDGHDAAMDAVGKGVVAVVCDRDLGIRNQIIVPNTRTAYAKLCENFFGDPSKKMNIIGVTGSKGKSTITYLIKNILTGMNHKCGLIGTIQNEFCDRVYESHNSTPDAFELQSLFADMAESGCKYCAMEVSSFALDQNRVGNTRFSIAVFTNLKREHLDYHENMESYYNAKKLLFSQADLAVINIDDEYGRRLCSEIDCKVVTYSVADSTADYYASNIKYTLTGSEFNLVAGEISGKVRFAMPGEFSVSNAVAGAAVCAEMGGGFAKITSSLNNFKGVKGRCEVVPTEQNFTVICDYAHTPDSLDKVLSAFKSQSSGRVVAVFGCGGDRDKGKRPQMGAAAAKHADNLIITSDNPRTEDPGDIINDILRGIDKTK
ncbi:MAG: UDP-N-acetylmuramoyl-L-alanyl-D-glutamate--2,6-diaminopimelate ligase, partial [Oscillospiraceae bacterium]|nr:UDP-N-acetylmuramoyl-L-alanyl-D-glutamate--2,6-diaminopimelate ligase [Oscillospiraceae bacterium]